MKKLFLLAFVMAMTMAASAQITWNAKLGGGLATLWGSDADDAKPHFVAKAGVGLEKPLSANLSLMPSLEVAWKGFKYDESGFDFTGDILYLQIPIVAAYRVNLSSDWNLALKAGPYFAYSVYDHGKVSSGGYSYSASNELDIKKFDVGLDAGIDFEYHRFVFGVEGEMGFLSLAGSDAKINNLAFYATVGYKF